MKKFATFICLLLSLVNTKQGVTSGLLTRMYSHLKNEAAASFSPVPPFFYLTLELGLFKKECKPTAARDFFMDETFKDEEQLPLYEALTAPTSSTAEFAFLTESKIFVGDEWTVSSEKVPEHLKNYFELLKPKLNSEKLSKEYVQRYIQGKSYKLLEIESNKDIGPNTIDIFISYTVLFYSLNHWELKEASLPSNENAQAFFTTETYPTTQINLHGSSTDDIYFIKLNQTDSADRGVWLALNWSEQSKSDASASDFAMKVSQSFDGKISDWLDKLNSKSLCEDCYIPFGQSENIIDFNELLKRWIEKSREIVGSCLRSIDSLFVNSSGRKYSSDQTIVNNFYSENILKINEKGIFLTSMFGESFSLTPKYVTEKFIMPYKTLYMAVFMQTKASDYEIIFVNKVKGTGDEKYLQFVGVEKFWRKCFRTTFMFLVIVLVSMLSITAFNVLIKGENDLTKAVPGGIYLINFWRMVTGRKRKFVMTNYGMNETEFLEH